MKITNASLALVVALSLLSCSGPDEFRADFDQTNDRYWIGQEFWSIPLEDWQVKDGRIECRSRVPEARVFMLTRKLAPGAGDFTLSARMGLLGENGSGGSAGFLIGWTDAEDPDVRAACYYGNGVRAGISLEGNDGLNGRLFLGTESRDLPEGFDFHDFHMEISGNNHSLSLQVSDGEGKRASVSSSGHKDMEGLIALAQNISSDGIGKQGNRGKTVQADFWFDDLELGGSKVIRQDDQAFGPVLWTTYTLSRNTLRLMAQMPPIGEEDNRQAELQIKSGENPESGSYEDWKTMAVETMDPDSRTVIFTLKGWDAGKDVPFRVLYKEVDRLGKSTEHFYGGSIRRDPVDRPLRMAGLTCQHHNGFPYTPLVRNLENSDPDLLYFSGDQIYEGNGGYPIKRKPEDASILSYLGKYYMFGWTFGKVMRDRPTICTPDDHDVFHGNLWGESGKLKDKASDDQAGFVQSVRMVNGVNRTQCGNLPDPYDPAPIGDGMSVWYTDLVYGRVSFAIISDRIYKSGPERVSYWEGRQDHMKEKPADPSMIETGGLEFAGQRQEEFLRDWAGDWEGADMKVLLSQTVFANTATHHGGFMMYLYGDLDSGGWPKKKRDELVKIMRSCFAFHVNGDQHLPSLVQYGVDEYRDGGWSFCTPAISVGYQRAFLPDELGFKVRNRPAHGLANTGEYEDAFGNRNYVYAIGNPDKQSQWDQRYLQAHMRSSGFGILTFNTESRDIELAAYRFLAELGVPGKEFQFPGWPLTVNQLDACGSSWKHTLPEVRTDEPGQVLKVLEQEGNVLYSLRLPGTTFVPMVPHEGSYMLRIGKGDNVKEVRDVKTGSKKAIIF